jgi:hypothetical protein
VSTPEDRLNALEQAISVDPMQAALAAFDKRIAEQIASSPAPKPAEKPEPPAAPVNHTELAIQKLDSYASEVEQRDPTATEYRLMGTAAVEAVSKLREVVSDPAASMEDRLIAREKFAHAWQADAEGRARRVQEYGGQVRAQAEARVAEARQARADQAFLEQRELAAVGDQMGRLTGGEAFKAAVESGAMDASDADLQKANWSPAQVGLLHRLRERVVQVEESQIAGQGYQHFVNDRGCFAYVPADFGDPMAFAAQHGG